MVQDARTWLCIFYSLRNSRKEMGSILFLKNPNVFDTMVIKDFLTCLGQYRNLILTRAAKEACIGLLINFP